jgi:hypothetical protein
MTTESQNRFDTIGKSAKMAIYLKKKKKKKKNENFKI